MTDDLDLSRLRSGELLLGASAAGLLVVLFVDWFSVEEAGVSGWEALEVLRFLMLVLIGLAFGVVALTVLARPVAMPVAASVITTGVALLTLLSVLFRVGINEPGSNAAVAVEIGGYLGLALVAGIAAGAWRCVQDERIETGASQRQAERVLAVRGAPRPAPPERDPDRPSPGGGSAGAPPPG